MPRESHPPGNKREASARDKPASLEVYSGLSGRYQHESLREPVAAFEN